MALRTTSTLATVFYPILLVLVIQQSQKVWAGKMFTPLGFKYKVACLAEHLKVISSSNPDVSKRIVSLAYCVL